jgi:two-component system chemotaxis sensor kinase CheA
MVELIRNAIKHGIETSAERIKLKKPTKGILEIRSERKNGNYRIIIRDDGKGMDANQCLKKTIGSAKINGNATAKNRHEKASDLNIEKADQRFGLSSLQQLIEVNGGKINVQSESGKFCEFKITIPVKEN